MYRHEHIEWHEIDDALPACGAEWPLAQELKPRSDVISNIYRLVQARYNGGAADYTIMFDAQHGYLQARRDLVGREGRLSMRYVTVNKVIGNAPLREEVGAQ